MPAAHAADGTGEGRKGGHDIVVKGDNNQLVLGDENVVGRDNVSSSGHSEVGNGEAPGASTPTAPYATVHRNVAYLSERALPRATSAEIARFGPDTKVPVSCYVTGENVHGNTTWYLVRAETEFQTGYISAYYTTLTGAVSRCA